MRNNYIEVNILCNTENSSQLKDLGIAVTGDELFASRKATLNLDLIVGFYEASKPEECIIAYQATDITCLMPYEELKKLICK